MEFSVGYCPRSVRTWRYDDRLQLMLMVLYGIVVVQASDSKQFIAKRYIALEGGAERSAEANLKLQEGSAPELHNHWRYCLRKESCLAGRYSIRRHPYPRR